MIGNWRERILGLRDRLLANQNFQSRAASLPGAKIIARKRARDIFDLCAGFVYSQVLLACVELRLFDILLERPLSAEAMAERTSIPVEACQRLVDAAVSLGLFERRVGNRFGLAPLGAALAQNPSLTAMIEHHRHLYDDLRNPVALLRGAQAPTELGRFWPYAGAADPTQLRSQDVDAYTRLMSLSQPLVAEEVLDVYAISRHRRLLDVGGGEGAFLISAARRSPDLQLMLIDLPPVAARAEENLRNAGLGDRATVVPGDFFKDELPRGADIISLVRIALDHDDQHVALLLAAARRALPRSGALILAEPMLDPNGDDRMSAAYFGIYLMAMGRGRPRLPRQYAEIAHAAGFSTVEFLKGRHVLGTTVMVARA